MPGARILTPTLSPTFCTGCGNWRLSVWPRPDVQTLKYSPSRTKAPKWSRTIASGLTAAGFPRPPIRVDCDLVQTGYCANKSHVLRGALKTRAAFFTATRSFRKRRARLLFVALNTYSELFSFDICSALFSLGTGSARPIAVSFSANARW